MASIEVVSADRHTVAEVHRGTDDLGAYGKCKRPGCIWETDPDEGYSLEDVVDRAGAHVDEPHGAFR
jgi:hypothetical protein